MPPKLSRTRSAERRRALKLLAASANGATEAILAAHASVMRTQVTSLARGAMKWICRTNGFAGCVSWASGKDSIRELWLFGSRATAGCLASLWMQWPSI
jgi:hypothetical protein